VFAYEDICSSHQASPARVTLRNGINLTDRPIPRGYRRPGRRPHVPSSKTDNVKEPTRILSRFDWFRASAVPTRRDAKRRPTPKGRLRCWSALYVAPPYASTAFCTFVATAVSVVKERSGKPVLLRVLTR
jgi:hypothetical protein